MIAKLPAGHSNLVLQRRDYGNELRGAGRWKEARVQLTEAASWIGKNHAVTAQRGPIRSYLASASFLTGRAEAALATARQATDDSLTDYGPTHPRTMLAYGTLIEIVLELD